MVAFKSPRMIGEAERGWSGNQDSCVLPPALPWPHRGTAVGQESGRARPWFPWTYGVGESALPHSFIHSGNMPQGTSQAPGSKVGPEDADRQDPGSHRTIPLQRAQESTRREKRTREHSANRVRSTRRRDGQVSHAASSVNQGQARGRTSGQRGPSGRWMWGVLPSVWGRGTCASRKLDLDNEQRRQGIGDVLGTGDQGCDQSQGNWP